jgi:hypothetical protein
VKQKPAQVSKDAAKKEAIRKAVDKQRASAAANVARIEAEMLQEPTADTNKDQPEEVASPSNVALSKTTSRNSECIVSDRTHIQILTPVAASAS